MGRMLSMLKQLFKKSILIILFITSSIAVCNAQSAELKTSMERGKELYITNCQNCHMADGKGVSGAFPPLAKSDYLMKDLNRSIKQVLYGAQGKMVVNGVTYNGSMMGYKMLSNQEVADIMNYIRNSWGNSGEMVTPQQVEKVRK